MDKCLPEWSGSEPDTSQIYWTEKRNEHVVTNWIFALYKWIIISYTMLAKLLGIIDVSTTIEILELWGRDIERTHVGVEKLKSKHYVKQCQFVRHPVELCSDNIV